MNRLLRLELRRNSLLPLAPLAAVMFWFSLYRPGLAGSAVWSVRSLTLQNALQGIGPFTAGVTAWVASRDARRNAGDLIATTALPAWRRRLARWGACAGWGLAFYAVATAAQLAITARQATWGGPVWWPVLVGAVGILAFSAVGAVFGSYLPGRFVAPLVAIGSFLALAGGFVALAHHSPYARVTPLLGSAEPGAGVFHRALPDLGLVQLAFLGGIALAALGVLGLPAGSAGPWARRVALALALAGTGLAGSGVGLAGTSRTGPAGVVVPALHRAADDAPLGYQPVCVTDPVPVCAHPAYRKLLPDVAAALAPVLAPLAGLPGVPTRVVQTDEVEGKGAAVHGDPPVLYLALFDDPNGRQFARILRHAAALAAVGGRDPAQQAVALGMTIAAGDPAPADATPLTAAAQRFAALSPQRRRAWLTDHLADLRAGRLTLGDLP